MFEKKFQVRVKHFGEGYYFIQYAYFRIFPIWKSIYSWNEFGDYFSELDGWFPIGSNGVEKAEELANGFANIKDVIEFHKKQIEKKNKWVEEKKEFLKKAIPYQIKYIRK